jgi:hypothetical protein
LEAAVPVPLTPEALSRLQNLFDDIWLDLEREKSPHTFPWSVEASRFALARLLLECFDSAKELEQIKIEVLERIKSNSVNGTV